MPKKPLNAYKCLTFDVVGTLIDFESGLMDSLSAIAAEHGTRLAREDVLKAYRAERYRPDVQRFPDDLERSIWPSPRSWACRGTRSWAGACATTPPAGSPLRIRLRPCRRCRTATSWSR